MAVSNRMWGLDVSSSSSMLSSHQTVEPDTSIEVGVERYVREIPALLTGLLSRPVGNAGSTSERSAIQPALHRVAQLADLPEDWDSYGAHPLSNEAVARAYEILFALDEDLGREVGAGLQPYTIAPIANGGIQIEWRSPTAEIEVDIAPDGGLGYLYVDKRGLERAFSETDEPTWPDLMARIASTLPSAS